MNQKTISPKMDNDRKKKKNYNAQYKWEVRIGSTIILIPIS
jgi:hypothetical protein